MYLFNVDVNDVVLAFFIVKVYLHYKTITSQNVPSEAQTKNFFIS